MRLGERADDAQGIIAAAVVDKEVGKCRVRDACGRRLHLRIEVLHYLCFVVAGHNDCDFVHSSSLIYPWVRLANA